jgi:hypothetical protein
VPKIAVGRDDKGQEIFGNSIEFRTERESWNVYHLEDGTEIRLRVVVTNIIKTDLKNEAGEPIYIVRSQNVIDTRVPRNIDDAS